MAKITITVQLEIDESAIPALVNRIKNGLNEYEGAKVYITENKQHEAFVIPEA